MNTPWPLLVVTLACSRGDVPAAAAHSADTSGDGSGDSTTTESGACYGEGEEYFAKELDKACCSGLIGVSAEDVPRDDYTQDDYPPGCGPAPRVPPDLLICVACGDDTCGLDEHFCNCPDDCAAGEIGPTDD